MPQAVLAVAGFLGTIGIGTGLTAIVTGGMMVGALAGGVIAAVKGENILKGALKGGLIGGAVGLGVGLGAAAIGGAATAEAGLAPLAIEEVGAGVGVDISASELAAAQVAAGVEPAAAGVAEVTASGGFTGAMEGAKTAVVEAGKEIGGAAKGLLTGGEGAGGLLGDRSKAVLVGGMFSMFDDSAEEEWQRQLDAMKISVVGTKGLKHPTSFKTRYSDTSTDVAKASTSPYTKYYSDEDIVWQADRPAQTSQGIKTPKTPGAQVTNERVA
jgi:hypothetical protein